MVAYLTNDGELAVDGRVFKKSQITRSYVECAPPEPAPPESQRLKYVKRHFEKSSPIEFEFRKITIIERYDWNPIFAYLCPLCGDVVPSLQHMYEEHSEWINAYPIQDKVRSVSLTQYTLMKKAQRPTKEKGARYKHPLKPWQDPDSLFCDTEFLQDYLGKEPTKGTECKD